MSGSAFQLVFTAVVIVVWIWSSDGDVAKATRPDAGFPWFFAIVGAWTAVWLPIDIINHNWIDATCCAILTGRCIRVIWHWWRRRRQGKPSRVLGLVRNMGHRLAVVAIPVREGS